MSGSRHNGRLAEQIRVAVVGSVAPGDLASIVRARGSVAAVFAPEGDPTIGDQPVARSLDDAIDRADVVHVNVTGEDLAPMLRRVVEAGRPAVLHTIPTPADAAELAHLADVAATAGMLVAMPYVRRFYPMVRLARRRVRSGVVGPVQLARGTALVDGANEPAAFIELGAAWCDLLEFVSDHRIERVTATSVVSPHVEGRTDAVALMFTTDRGAAGTFVLSRLTAGARGELHIELDGVDESISFDERRPEVLDVAGARSLQRLQRGGEISRYSPLPPGHPQGFGECWDAYVGDSYARVRGGRPAGLPTIADLVRSAELMHAVSGSLETGDWVAVRPAATLRSAG